MNNLKFRTYPILEQELNSNFLKNKIQKREYPLDGYHRSNQDTCLVHKPAVYEGEWVHKGDLLADCSASNGGELALGRNILIAYMPWEGYNYEDAILISERLVYDDIYTSIHIENYECSIRDTKYGMEQLTRQIPDISPNEIAHLDSNGIVKLGTLVQEGDILVGKVTPIQKKFSSGYQKLLFSILEKEFYPARDSSLRVPRGLRAKVIQIQCFGNQTNSQPISDSILDKKTSKLKQKKSTESLLKQSSTKTSKAKTRLTNKAVATKSPSLIKISLAEKRKLQVGDKIAGRHGNKGIVSQILPRQDMPYLPDGTPVDLLLNPLGVPSRMNVGQIYECLLGLAGKYLGENYKIAPFDEIYGPEASRSFVYSKLYEARKKTGIQWLFNPNLPGKVHLFDGRTGEFFEQSVTAGYSYILKLVHLVDDKIHARSTGPYALVTQQPLRGRSKYGGQRLGEMEVWAIEGYGAAFTLLEMLTIKSDDMTGRMTLWSNIILQKEIAIGTPESFKVLVCELQALCLDIGLFKMDEKGFFQEIEHLLKLP